MEKSKLNVFILGFLLLIIICRMFVIHIEASENTVNIVYFYITSCSSCEDIKDILADLEDKNIKVIYKNIADKNVYVEFHKYLNDYKVPDDIKGIVPAIFIDNNYYIGEEAAIQELKKYDENSPSFYTNKTKEKVSQQGGISNLSYLGVFAAGILDGINPCAISMLLFFLSIIQTKKKKYLLLVGMSFIIGTYIAYFLLGTIFFNILSLINIVLLRGIFKIALILGLAVIIVLNILDLLAIKKDNYSKIILKLPLLLRKLSHNLIKKYSKFDINIGFLMLSTFVLGILISCTEFLCTGQIYLPTIVSILQLSNNQLLSIKAILLLLVYNLGFVIPLILILVGCYLGKHIYDMSELFRKNLRFIKMANIIFFSIFLIIYLFNL